jgi:hypothetical protein
VSELSRRVSQELTRARRVPSGTLLTLERLRS